MNLLSSVQKKNFPLKSWTAITAKINWKRIYTISMLMTFFSEFTTQSNTAFNFGTRLMVLRGRSTRSTLSDLIVDKFWPAELPLCKKKLMSISTDDFTSCIFFNNTKYIQHLIYCKKFVKLILTQSITEIRNVITQ